MAKSESVRDVATLPASKSRPLEKATARQYSWSVVPAALRIMYIVSLDTYIFTCISLALAFRLFVRLLAADAYCTFLKHTAGQNTSPFRPCICTSYTYPVIYLVGQLLISFTYSDHECRSAKVVDMNEWFTIFFPSSNPSFSQGRFIVYFFIST